MGTNNHLDLLDTLFMSPEGTGVHRIARLGTITLGQTGIRHFAPRAQSVTA